MVHIFGADEQHAGLVGKGGELQLRHSTNKPGDTEGAESEAAEVVGCRNCCNAHMLRVAGLRARARSGLRPVRIAIGYRTVAKAQRGSVHGGRHRVGW